MTSRFDLFVNFRIEEVLKEFSFNKYSKSIQTYKPSFNYKQKQYELDPLDYLWILYQSISAMYQIGINFFPNNPDLFSCILYKLDKDNLIPYSSSRGIDIKNGISMLRFSSDENNIISRYPFTKISAPILEDNFFNNDFVNDILNILKKMNHFSINIYILNVTLKKDNAVHQALIFIQVLGNKILVHGYDCLSRSTQYFFTKMLSEVVEHIKNCIDDLFDGGFKLNYGKIDKILGTCSRNESIFEILYSELLGVNNSGFCIIYTCFIFYILLYVICNCNTIIIPSINDIILYIDIYLVKKYRSKPREILEIIKTFTNKCIENYYLVVNDMIDKQYKNLDDNKYTKTVINETIYKYFTNLFERYFLQKIEPVKNEEKCQHDEQYKTKKCRENKCMKDRELMRDSGFSCRTDDDCESKKCTNGICDSFINYDLLQIESDDLRGEGNACFHNLECRSKLCVDNVCIGDIEQESHDKDINLDNVYIEEWMDVDNILDSENKHHYIKNNKL